MKNIEIIKNEQRKLSKKKRLVLSRSNINVSVLLEKNLSDLKFFNDAKIIASFLSINSEISTKHLNKYIKDKKKIICLPVIKESYQYLIFHEYNLNNKLKIGKFGIKEPQNIENQYLPNIIFTPCLAFDEFGHRLGYGGGFYDKTFSYYKKIKHNFISIVFAYEGQKIDNVIHNKFDQKIDYILTEKELYKV